jgi:replicative DNA helicase
MSSFINLPSANWEPPTPIDEIGPLPAFPVHCLPPVLRDFVEAEAEATQTPVELAACLSLAVVSACAAGSYEVEVRPGYREPIQIFALVTLPPGERKSAVFADCTRPLREFEREQVEASAPKIQAAIARHKILEIRSLEAIKRAAKSGDPMDAQLAEQLSVELAEHIIPTAPRYVADDTTPERLAGLLSENGGRLAVMSAEGGLFETFAGRYSDGVANIETLLKGHAGDMLRVDRQNRAAIHVDRPALTLGMCVQPDVLAGLAQKPTFRGRGLLARLLFALPQSKMGRRLVVAPPVPEPVKAAYDRMCRNLLASRRDDPATLTFARSDLERLDRFAAELEPRLGPDGDLVKIRDWAAKLVGASVRISALLHLASHSAHSAYSAGQSEILSGNETSEIASFFLSHSIGAFQLMGGDPVTHESLRALHWLKFTYLPHNTHNTHNGVSGSVSRIDPAAHNTHNTQNTFARRDLFNALRSTTIVKVDDVDPVLAMLTEHGYVRPVEQPATSTVGRKRSPRFEVSPFVRRELVAA